MNEVSHLKLMSNSFDKLHDQLSVIRGHAEALNDEEAVKLVGAMEFGLLAPLRKLRAHLRIPYDWHEQRNPRKERAHE
ncbi:MAG: hypothetical protein FJ118_15610 [Deltaproteobacteria bacterium]|nr:hypothetical protein [Deltaproteobacteria bacterium]